MNAQIRKVGLALVVCFAALFVQLNWLQIFGADRLEANPNNTRAIIRDFGRDRGTIATAEGVIVAQSVEVDGDLERERRYPEGDLYAHATGYHSFNFGATGVEKVYNELLAGRTDEQRYGDLGVLLTGEDPTGNLTLTLRHDVQQVARDALGDRNGSVVAIDPRDGSILALWSYPSYDPNLIATTDLDAASDAFAALRDLDPVAPDLAKSYRQSFAPGSTFKVVTAAAGLSSGVATPASPVFEASSSYTPPLTSSAIANFGGSTCGGDIAEGLRVSCNTVFAELAAEYLGPGPLVGQAEAFGFNDTPPIDLTSPARSRFPSDFGAFLRASDVQPDADIVEDTPRLAQTAIGQNDVSATPLQMALVAAAVANEGVIMRPHVMDEVRNRDGDVVEDYSPSVWKVALRPSVAQALRTMMVDVVTAGTAGGLAVPGFQVGGKTGTAETLAASDDTHSWIIGFAGPPGEAPTVAVAVIVEAVAGQGQITGGTVAAPIAQQVLAAALAPMQAATVEAPVDDTDDADDDPADDTDEAPGG